MENIVVAAGKSGCQWDVIGKSLVGFSPFQSIGICPSQHNIAIWLLPLEIDELTCM